jgi:hypothetical protein
VFFLIKLLLLPLWLPFKILGEIIEHSGRRRHYTRRRHRRRGHEAAERAAWGYLGKGLLALLVIFWPLAIGTHSNGSPSPVGVGVFLVWVLVLAAAAALVTKARKRSAEVSPAPPESSPPAPMISSPAPEALANQRPAWMKDGAEVALFDGPETLEVVGESHYQENLWRLVGGRRDDPGQHVRAGVDAVLVAEDANPHDADAVSVWINGLKVGYLSRHNARRYRPGLLALQDAHRKPVALTGVIVGGGIRQDGPGRLGVFLEHDPADFGLPPAHTPR